MQQQQFKEFLGMNDTQDGSQPVGAAHYRAYLLRIWNGSQAGLHASLQDAKTGLRLGFSSLEELFAYLMDETERPDREQKDGVDHPVPPSS